MSSLLVCELLSSSDICTKFQVISSSDYKRTLHDSIGSPGETTKGNNYLIEVCIYFHKISHNIYKHNTI
jgi:hypothetical protein